MKKLTILLIPLLITMTLLSMNFGCDEAEEIKDNIQDKVEDITGDSTPKSKKTLTCTVDIIQVSTP